MANHDPHWWKPRIEAITCWLRAANTSIVIFGTTNTVLQLAILIVLLSRCHRH